MKQPYHLLAGLLLCLMLPACDEEKKEPSVAAFLQSGSGTREDPYQIRTVEELNDIRGQYLADHFLLMNDLDFEGYAYDHFGGWRPIGRVSVDERTDALLGMPFSGSFNGDGHVIRNLRIARAGEHDADNMGLFGVLASRITREEGTVRGGEVRDVGLEAVSVRGYSGVGGLVGFNSGTIRNCHVSGALAGSGDVGGLVGFNSGTIRKSYATATVEGLESIGGLVGGNSGTISENYATGQVSGNFAAGGLVGDNSRDSAVVNCYATGQVSGGTRVGGLVGWDDGSTIRMSYATGRVSEDTQGSTRIGGLVGSGGGFSSTIAHCYWNTTTSGQTEGIGADSDTQTGVAGLTTAEMYVQSNFVDWNFTSIWQAPNADNMTFPLLREVARP